MFHNILVGPSLGRAGGEKLYFYFQFVYIRKLMFVHLTMSAHIRKSIKDA
jgi:hypothetical protein